jgi:hypothetical protein
MKKTDEEIDFTFTQEIAQQISKSSDLPECEIIRLYWPIHFLNRMHNLLCAIYNEIIKSADYKVMQITPYEVNADMPVFNLIHCIMLNNVSLAEEIIHKSEVDVNRNLSDTVAAFKFYQRDWNEMYNYTFLTIAAILGRTEIFKLLIDQGADPGKLISLSGMYPAPLSLSVNECLMMNALYHWHKSGTGEKLLSANSNALIDAIMLASKISSSIVSDERLMDTSVRITFYWKEFKNIIGNPDLLNRLVSLNKKAIQNMLNIS